MGGSPTPPPPAPTPNPYMVAAAQTSTNISTAIVNSRLQNANEENPQATVDYEVVGNYELEDPQYNASGVVGSTTTRQIPIYKRTVAFKPKPQQVYDKNLDLQISLGDLGITQADQLATSLGTPFSLASLPAGAGAPAEQTFIQTVSSPGSYVRTIGSTDLLAHIETIRQAVLYRTTVQLDQARDALIASLLAQGLVPGMEAYDRAIRAMDWRVNDQQQQAYLAAQQEQSRIINVEAMVAQFANQATRQTLDTAVLVGNFQNEVSRQRFTMLHSIADFTNTVRARTMQEKMTERSIALNEISVLLHGGQVQMPQFDGFRPGHIETTNIGSFIYQSAALDMQKYQSQVQQAQFNSQRRDEMIGGMLGAGASIISAGITSGAIGGKSKSLTGSI